MPLTNADGDLLTENEFTTGATSQTHPNTYVVGEHVYETFPVMGALEPGRRLKYYAGQVISKAEYDALFADPTITSITPDEGDIAGETVVTIVGTNLAHVTGVTFGGDAGTDLVRVSGTTMRVVTPEHAAGAVNVVVTTQGGSVTSTGGYTYVDPEA